MDINDRLREARERLHTKRKFDAMLKEAHELVRTERRRLADFKEKLAQEKGDVETLEGFGLTRLFYTILGTKEERLEKERQEYLSAKLQYEQTKESLDRVEREAEQLASDAGQYAQADQEYEQALQEKAQVLATTNNPRAARLAELAEKRGDLEATQKELREALEAGRGASHALNQVRDELRSAANWGTWDMLGGGWLATMAKHSRIDAAKDHAFFAQQKLQKFQLELAEAGERLQVDLEIGDFSRFADYFFDGLIMDWIVQSKIQQASASCEAAIARVDSAIHECTRRATEIAEALRALETERRQCIEEA